jgi:hypothetical protein
MLRWVEGALGQTIEYGARCIEEQRDDTNRMSCHTSSYASVLAQYAEKLVWNQFNGTAAAESVEAARRSWAWSSYCMDDLGNIHVSPDGGESDTWCGAQHTLPLFLYWSLLQCNILVHFP